MPYHRRFSAWVQCGVGSMKEFSVQSFEQGKLVTCLVVSAPDEVPDSFCWSSHGLGHPSKIRLSTERDANDDDATSSPKAAPQPVEIIGPLRRSARNATRAANQDSSVRGALPNVAVVPSNNEPKVGERICTVKAEIFFSKPMGGPKEVRGSLPLCDDAVEKVGGRHIRRNAPVEPQWSGRALPSKPELLPGHSPSTSTPAPVDEPYITFRFTVLSGIPSRVTLPPLSSIASIQPLSLPIIGKRSRSPSPNLTKPDVLTFSSSDESDLDPHDDRAENPKRPRHPSLVESVALSETTATACSPVYEETSADPVTPMPSYQHPLVLPPIYPSIRTRRRSRSPSLASRLLARGSSSMYADSSPTHSRSGPRTGVLSSSRQANVRIAPQTQADLGSPSHRTKPSSALLSPWLDSRAAMVGVAVQTEPVRELDVLEQSPSPSRWDLVDIHSEADDSEDDMNEDDDTVLLKLEQRLVETHQLILRLRRRRLWRRHAIMHGA